MHDEHFLELPDINSHTMYLEPIHCEEIYKIILSMQDKAGGADKINAKVLKCLSTYICVPLEHIFNLCILKSSWPNALKKAEVVPIFKSGNKNIMMNYRPISLISNIAKIFERLVFNRLIKFLNDKSIISDKQFGFLKDIGTKDALAYVSKQIYEKLNKPTPILATFLDLEKAFDTVNHNILFKKLSRYGIRGTSLDLLKII